MCRDNVEGLYYNFGDRGVYDIRHPYDDPTPPSYFTEYLNQASIQQAIGVVRHLSFVITIAIDTRIRTQTTRTQITTSTMHSNKQAISSSEAFSKILNRFSTLRSAYPLSTVTQVSLSSASEIPFNVLT